MQVILYLVLFLLPFAAWITAECRWGTSARIGLGAVCLLFVGFAWFSTLQRAANTEARYAACLREMGSALDSGDVERVRRAIAAYDTPGSSFHRVTNTLDVLCGNGEQQPHKTP